MLRLYRFLVRLCSPSLRREYGAAMEETFARRLADAHKASAWRRAHLVRRELTGVAVLAVSDRLSATGRWRRLRKDLTMSAFSRELRHAARRLRRSPAFTLATVLTLALAIGANASIFAVVQRVLLNPLPYPDSDRIIALDHGAAGLNTASGMGMTPGLYLQYREQTHSLDDLAVYRNQDVNLTGIAVPERLRVARVTPSLASVLRVAPAQGRWFDAREGEPGGPPAVVLSHDLWMRRFGGDISVLGRALNLSGVPTTVVGIMPAGFGFPDPLVDAWMPEPVTRAMGLGIFNYTGIARLRDGVTIEGVRADLNSAIADLPRVYPDFPKTIGYNLHLTSTALPLKEQMVGRIARTLWILLASVGLVLLIACANVANLFLVRFEAREREVAVRRALGASGAAIVRYFLAESALLSLAGGIGGLTLAWAAVHLLADLAPATLPRRGEVRLDGAVLVFTLAVTLMVALIFALLPMLRARTGAGPLHESGRGNTASRSRHRLRHVLMGAQVAFALVLLVSSGLMVRSFQKLRTIDPGFDPRSTLTFRIGLPRQEYPNRRAIVAGHQRILDQLVMLPGVTAVSASTCLPLAEEGTCFSNSLFVDGRPMPPDSLPPGVAFRAVAGDYVEALGLRLRAGRSLTRGDIDRGEPAVVINEALAKTYFPNENPIGKRIASSSPAGPAWLTIVGIVANTPVRALAEPAPVPSLYMPMSLAGAPDIPVANVVGPNILTMSYVLRTTTPPLGLMPSARKAIDKVDPNLPIIRVRTMQDTLDRAAAYMAFTMLLLAIAAGVALVLGVIGIYGVMSYIVSQRTNEIGIRLALGADPGRVARDVVWQGGVVALAGIVAGLGAAFATGRLLESLLYGISPRDPGVFIATTLTLLAVAVCACWIPARRAASIDPTEALRASG
jgi:putative ABC transport system permease protein